MSYGKERNIACPKCGAIRGNGCYDLRQTNPFSYAPLARLKKPHRERVEAWEQGADRRVGRDQ